MKTRVVQNNKKDVRVVVRVAKDDSDWLKNAANKADSSVGRIIRRAIRVLRSKEKEGALSFNVPQLQLAGFGD